MQWPSEDAVSALLTDQPGSDQPDIDQSDIDRPDLGRWLLMVGVMALGMTPLGLMLAGIWGALLTCAFFIFVWLASTIWFFVRHGSPGSANVLPSAMMVVAWPGLSVLFEMIR